MDDKTKSQISCVPARVQWSHEVLYREPRAKKESPLKEWWLEEQRKAGKWHFEDIRTIKVKRSQDRQ